MAMVASPSPNRRYLSRSYLVSRLSKTIRTRSRALLPLLMLLTLTIIFTVRAVLRSAPTSSTADPAAAAAPRVAGLSVPLHAVHAPPPVVHAGRPNVPLSPGRPVYVSTVAASVGASGAAAHHHTAAGPVTPVASQALHIVLVAQADTTETELRATLDSVQSHVPQASVHLVHFTTRPDPALLHLVATHATVASRRPYDDPLLAVPEHLLAPSAAAPSAVGDDEQTPTLLLRAGARLSSHAFPWLLAALRAYGSRPDLAAIALDAVLPRARGDDAAKKPDHDQSAWEPAIHERTGPSRATAALYRLLPSADALLLNANPSLRVWATFHEWLTLRRADWYHYPRGAGVDGTPLGRAGMPDSNWTRAPWNVWFSKFLQEYRLTVAFPHVDGGKLVSRHESELLRAEHDADATSRKWPMLPKPEVWLGNGHKVPGSYFGGDTIDHIVKLAEQNGNTISMTLVNKVFLETSHSWLCNVDGGGFRPAGLVWAVTDEETRDSLSAIKGAHTVWLARVKGGKETGNEFGNPGYWKLMLERTMLITEILARGVSVFAFETDAIWLEDPRPAIDALVQEEADIVGTINTRNEVSGNFFFLRPTLATRRLWHEITDGFERAYNKERFEKKKPTSWTYIQNDQSLLTQMVLRNATWRAMYPLSFMTLDMEKFVDGRWYTPKEGFYTSKRAREPVVINNNFLIGVKEKKVRAKKHGHWFWDQSKKQCLDDVVKKAVRKVKK